MKIYVNAKSKKAVNELLQSGQTVYGYNYSVFEGGGTYVLSSALPVGTVIAIYEKTIGGNPYAKSYGTWDGSKVK
jgi:hypothetical protein